MAWVERADLRGQKHKVEQDSLDPTRFRASLTISDAHYHDGAAWQPIDESILGDSSVVGFTASCTKVRHTVRFGTGGQRRWYPRRDVTTEYVETRAPEYWNVSQARWRAWTLAGYQRSANRISFEATDYRIVITNTWHQLRLSYTLKTANAYTRVRYPWTLVGLTYDNATHEFRSTADQTIVGTLAQPVAVDANGTAVPVTGTYGGDYFEIVLTPGSAVYPIAMDPDDTFTDGSGGTVETAYDTYVVENAADTTAGTTTDFRTNSAAGYRKFALLRFDLSSLAGATVTSATLSCYNQFTHTANLNFGLNVLLAADSAWTEAGATWNHLDGTNHWAGDAAQDGGTDAGCSASGTDFNAASLGTLAYLANTVANSEIQASLTVAQVQAWIDSGNYGLRIGPSDANNRIWNSSDHATTGYHPKLVVVYTPAVVGGQPTQLRGLDVPGMRRIGTRPGIGR